MEPAAPAYPATLEIQPAEHIANWRPLVHWLLVIPHLIVLNVLGLVAGIVGIIAWFAILFTGRLPEGLAGFQALYIRYANRTYAYEWFMREEYPPFAFDMAAADPGEVAGVRTDLEFELEGRNRLTTAFRWILAIPHFVVITLLAIARLSSSCSWRSSWCCSRAAGPCSGPGSSRASCAGTPGSAPTSSC